MKRFLGLLAGLALLSLTQPAEAFPFFRRNVVNVNVNNGFAGVRGNAFVNVNAGGFFRRSNVNVNVGNFGHNFVNVNRFGFNQVNFGYNGYRNFGFSNFGYNRVAFVGGYAPPVAVGVYGAGYGGCDLNALRSYNSYGPATPLSEETTVTAPDGTVTRTLRQFR